MKSPHIDPAQQLLIQTLKVGGADALFQLLIDIYCAQTDKEFTHSLTTCTPCKEPETCNCEVRQREVLAKWSELRDILNRQYEEQLTRRRASLNITPNPNDPTLLN